MALTEIGDITKVIGSVKGGLTLFAEGRHGFKMLEKIAISLNSSTERHSLDIYDFEEFNQYGIDEADIIDFMIADLEGHEFQSKDRKVHHAETFKKEPFISYHVATRGDHSDGKKVPNQSYLRFKDIIADFARHDRDYMEQNLWQLDLFTEKERTDFPKYFALETIEESILKKFPRYEEHKLGLLKEEDEEEYKNQLIGYLGKYKKYSEERAEAGLLNAKGMGGVVQWLAAKNPKFFGQLGKFSKFTFDLKDHTKRKNPFTKFLSIAFRVLTHKTTGRVLIATGMILSVVLASLTPAGPLVPLAFFAAFLVVMAVSVGFDAYSRYNARQIKKENLLLQRLERLRSKSIDLDKKLNDTITKDNFDLGVFKARPADNIENTLNNLPKIRSHETGALKTIRTSYGESLLSILINTGLVISAAPNPIGLTFALVGMFVGVNADNIDKDFLNLRKDNLKWQNTELKMGAPKYKNLAELEKLVEEQQIQNRAKKTILGNLGVEGYEKKAVNLSEVTIDQKNAFAQAIEHHKKDFPEKNKHRILANIGTYFKEVVGVFNPFAPSIGSIYEQDLLGEYRRNKKESKNLEIMRSQEVLVPRPVIEQEKPRAQDIHTHLSVSHVQAVHKTDAPQKGL